MSIFGSWIAPDYENPTQRFVYVDGAPYDGGPDAINPLQRALRTPSYIVCGVSLAFCAVASALLLPEGGIKGFAVASTVAASIATFSTNIPAYLKRRYSNPELGPVVIDKTGKILSDPKASIAVRSYLVEQRDGDLFGALVLVPVMYGVFRFMAAKGYLDQVTPNGIDTLACLMAPFVPRFVADFAWMSYARRQLGRQRWTVTTDPPHLKSEQQVSLRPALSRSIISLGGPDSIQ